MSGPRNFSNRRRGNRGRTYVSGGYLGEVAHQEPERVPGNILRRPLKLPPMKPIKDQPEEE